MMKANDRFDGLRDIDNPAVGGFPALGHQVVTIKQVQFGDGALDREVAHGAVLADARSTC